ncbi:MAG: hypothetical protein ACI92Z_002687 [Paracoccaceae bacterium]|jgi:hypothetical protein
MQSGEDLSHHPGWNTYSHYAPQIAQTHHKSVLKAAQTRTEKATPKNVLYKPKCRTSGPVDIRQHCKGHRYFAKLCRSTQPSIPKPQYHAKAGSLFHLNVPNADPS